MVIVSRFTTGLMPGKRDASWAYTIGKGKVALRVSRRSKRTRCDNGPNCFQKTSTKLVPSFQYLRRLNGVDSMVNPPQCSHFGHHLINKIGIGRFRKQF